jgi:hypothetical protein
MPNHATPCSMNEIRGALKAAWASAFGEQAPAPSDASICLLAAQIDLETAGGRAVMGYNLGNVKGSQSDPNSITFATFEYVNGRRVELPAGDPGAYFRSWETLAAGAEAYLLIMRGRFGVAWPFVLSGDTAGFAAALRAKHYYTAPEEQYAAGLFSRGAPSAVEVSRSSVPGGEDERVPNPLETASTVAPANPGGGASGLLENADNTASAPVDDETTQA